MTKDIEKITKKEQEIILKLRRGENVGIHNGKPDGEPIQTSGRQLTSPDNNGKDKKRASDKNPENLQVQGEGLEPKKPEETKPEEYTCEDCDNVIQKGQPKCGFCGANLNWQGVE